jgi:tetratricopeptide (TPR) repeat protein
MTFDVVVRNERVGHRFPGGVLDAQDTWIELVVEDARGRRLAHAGVGHRTADADATAHVFRAVQADERGEPLLLRETDRFRAPVFNHTVAPRDAEAVRYRFDVPRWLDARSLPLRVTARLVHRARNLLLARATCAESWTARGTAFAREVAKRTGGRMDACEPPPVTEIARSETWIGGGTARESTVGPEAWRRLYDHGLALLHGQQEDVDGARPSLDKALELLPVDDTRDRAMVLQAMGDLEIHEGRTADAMRRLDDADRLLPGHPAIDRARGEALGNIWQWKDAAGPLARTARASPLDDGAWARLAVAFDSESAARDALEAARVGLDLVPRDADLLRVQALALETLGGAQDDVARAREAFAQWRAPDNAPRIKSACAAQVSWCAVERLPVHVHRMAPN